MTVAPTVHLNGTSGDELLVQLSNAITSVDRAIEALRAAYPHMRDYYVQKDGDAAYTIARNAADARIGKLVSVAGELEDIAVKVSDQVLARA